MATPRKPPQHPEDKDRRRRERICRSFMDGKSASEIAKLEGVTKEVASGIISRAGLSRGHKPTPPRRFTWQEGLPDSL